MPRRFTFSLILIAILALTACTAQATPVPQPTAIPTDPPTLAPDPTPITLTDSLARQVTLDAPAQRVISLAPSNTEILFALGAGSQVIGRDEFTNFPEESLDLPSIGGSFGDYNFEAIIELDPDLVLAAKINPPELVESLADLGLVVFLVPNPTELPEMFDILVQVGQLTGRVSEANMLVETLSARVAAVEESLAGVTQQPTVFYQIDSTEPSAPWTIGPGTFVDTLIRMAGGENIGGVLDSPYAQISIEELVAQDPQIILLGDAIWGVTPEDVAGRSGWESLDAVQNDRLYPFNDDLVSRPGPRLVDGLEALARLLHPDQFE